MKQDNRNRQALRRAQSYWADRDYHYAEDDVTTTTTVKSLSQDVPLEEIDYGR